MKLNEHTRLWGNNVVLVPYEKLHVEKYHEWMKDDELQELTASEPLTLEQEYAMQISWRADSDKCTFIVLDQKVYEISNDEIDSMVGDVNIFLCDADDPTQAEVEVMIAERSKRNGGRGKEALLSMLRYGTEELKIKSFVAKIKENNSVSLKLFKSLGFEEISRSELFGEITLSCSSNERWKRLTPSYRLELF